MMTFDIDAAMARMRDRLKPRTPEELQEAQQRAIEEALIIARALDNPAGKAALDLLYQKFCTPLEFDPSLGFENGAAVGFARNGQSQVVYWLGQMIERARTGGAKGKTLKAGQTQRKS